MPDEKQQVLNPLAAALRATSELIARTKVPAVIVGGVAASLLGRPRVTKDVDLLVWLEESQWPEFLAAARSCGFVERVKNSLAFAAERRVLLLTHQASGIDLDVALGAIPFELDVVQRATNVEVQGLELVIPTPEDLVIMKLVAHRPRDFADIEGVLDANPALDSALVRRTLGEFAEVLPEYDLISEFDHYLAKHQRGS